MAAAKTGHQATISLKALIESLHPQISVTVRWACTHYHHFPEQSVVDDLTQEITLLLMKDDCQKLCSFEGRSTVETWLRTVILHHVGHHFKNQKPAESLAELPLDSLPMQPPVQEQEVLLHERKKLVERAQSELTIREKQLWKLFCAELSDEEIAERTNIKVRSVQRKKSALLKKIKGLVEKLGG